MQVGRKISVDAYQRKTYAYRKRLLGGFYAYEQTAEVKRVGEVCSGKTDAHGFLLCDGEAPETGELVLVANAKDDDGNVAQASSELYVADADNWYAASPNDRIDVLPEKRDYKPGETARFEVRMPFREATALVTVEREGVLYSNVVTISAKSPFVEIPVAQNFGPNTYVSVMVVRGRIDPEKAGRFSWLRRLINRIGVFLGLAKKLPPDIDTHPTALVDLTKPAFKLGIARIKVGWDAYELKVKVEPEKPVYKIRDRAFVKIHVTDAAGKPAANAEIALAAVDEGLLSLAAPTSWNLLEAMMQRRPEEVVTSTAQSQVIGKRHFGKKSAAPGGGGGGEGANARELFDTLLLWKPVVQLDAQRRRARRSAAQRFADGVPHRRHRPCRRHALRLRHRDHPHDPGSDAVRRLAAVRARRRPVRRDGDGAQRRRPAADARCQRRHGRRRGRKARRQAARQPESRARRARCRSPPACPSTRPN